jgi:hypothetical protein
MPLISTLGVMNATGFGFAANKKTSAVLFGGSASPYISAYPFNTSQGYGTKYADPTTLPSAASGIHTGSVSFNYGGTLATIVYNSTAPYISIYPFSNGFGTKYANLGTPVVSIAASFNYDSSAIAVTVTGTPFLSAYRWNNGFGTKYIDAASAIASFSIRFSNSGIIFTGASAPPYENAYPFNYSTGFGTRYSDPSVAVQGRISGIGINETSTSILYSNSTGTPFLSAYAWSSGFSTKYTAPATIPTAGQYGANFNKPGTVVNVGGTFIYPWSNSTGFGTKYATSPSASGSPSFNATNTALIVGYLAYPWSDASGIGTKYIDPSPLPSVTVSTITPY